MKGTAIGISCVAIFVAALTGCMCLYDAACGVSGGLWYGAFGTLFIGFVAGLCYRFGGFATRAGWWILLLGWVLVVTGIAVNIWFYTVAQGGTLAAPVLNDYDTWRHWAEGYELAGYGYAGWGKDIHHGYAYLVALGMRLFGCNVWVPSLMSGLWCLLSIVVISALTYELTSNKITATIAMGIMVSLTYFMTLGTVLYKDDMMVLLCGAYLLLCLKMIRGVNRHRRGVLIIAMCLVVGLTALVRTGVLLFFALATVLLGCSRSNAPARLHHSATLHIMQSYTFRAVVLAALLVVVYVLVARVSVTGVPAEMLDNPSDAGVYYSASRTAAYDNLIGSDYGDMPIWQRLLWLPVSVVTQFLIPLPWNYHNALECYPAAATAHFGFTWYYAVALFCAFLVLYWRKSSPQWRSLIIWGIFIYLGIAFMTNGRISRYAMMAYPAIIPAAAYVLHHDYRRKGLLIWLGIFSVLLAFTLCVCSYLIGKAL